jgi:hypothetical protein
MASESHPLWPKFVEWYKDHWIKGCTPNVNIQMDASLWDCFLAGAASNVPAPIAGKLNEILARIKDIEEKVNNLQQKGPEGF